MIIADLGTIAGRLFPARRKTQNLVGGVSPVKASNFALGHVSLEPNGGQVPWHNQEQEEIYFILEGEAEMCLGKKRQILKEGQAVYIPSGEFSSADKRVEASLPYVVLLWSGGRRRALAAGIGRHFAARWNRCTCPSARRRSSVR